MSAKRTLVIVESGAKAKTISKYLNALPDVKSHYGHFDVVACFGHIMDLDRKGLGVDKDNEFKPTLKIIPDKQKLVKELKSKVAKADHVLLASDADREGAAIAKHLQIALGLRKNFRRITFNEITPSALKSAIAHAGDIDENLVLAQQARRVLDRLVGYEISPLLWHHFKNGGLLKLSAGRVQSATLHLLVSKHTDAIAFKSESYYVIQSKYEAIVAQLYTKQGRGNVVHLEANPKEIEEMMKMTTSKHIVEDVVTKAKSESPPKPFATPTLQQESHTRLGFSVGRTMKLAQDLYEAGHITYMRTDSTHLSEDASNSIRNYIMGAFGSKYVASDENGSGHEKRNQKQSAKHSQEAHECIRPTDVNQNSIAIDKNMTKEHVILYDLIWRRSIASLMAKMIFDETTVILSEPSLTAKDWAFVIKSNVIVFDGYTRVWVKNGNKAGQQQSSKKGMDFRKGKSVDCVELLGHQVWSSPPSRYNDATLIKAMESHGIGRPSTYASVLTKLLEKQYVEKKTISGIEKECTDLVWNPSSKSVKHEPRTVVVGEDKNKMVPTDIGINVNQFIIDYFDRYADSEFTASMEMELDRMAKGEVQYKAIMQKFWKGLDESLMAYKKTHVKQEQTVMDLDKGKVIVVDKVPYTLRRTKYGPAIQYDNPDSKDGSKKFVSLKAYLKLTGMNELDEISKDDIRLLVSLPCPMNHDKTLKLHYGQYGFYLKRGEHSFSMFVGKHYNKDDVPRNMLDLSQVVLERITSWTPKSNRQAT
jgi:DNA topoisomerase-1